MAGVQCFPGFPKENLLMTSGPESFSACLRVVHGAARGAGCKLTPLLGPGPRTVQAPKQPHKPLNLGEVAKPCK